MTKSQHPARLEFDIRGPFLAAITRLPWHIPIDAWNRNANVQLIDIKRGVGRHPLVFVAADGHHFAIKELSAEVSRKEIRAYNRMQAMGISTLTPVGTVVRHDPPVQVFTPVGAVMERNLVGHSVTLVADRVLPDSQLYRRDFHQKNRQRILDAVIDLFVTLHTNGVFWGDASLANTLIHFSKETIPHLGMRTSLKAYLADAETVEIHMSLSDAKRREDVAFFVESMQWIDEDMRARGELRKHSAVADDAGYITDRYEAVYASALQQRAFESETGLPLATLLGRVTRPEYVDSLRRDIDEHKWYMSEGRRKEVTVREAAEDWMKSVFLPVTEVLREESVLEVLPGRTASELYVEIMVHKYYLSLQEKRDVGTVVAIRDYIDRFGKLPSSSGFLQELTERLLTILGIRERRLFLSKPDVG